MTNDKLSEEKVDASRRAVMSGFVGLGVAAPLLAACGSGDSGNEDSGNGDSGNADSGNDGGGTTSSGVIGTTSEVPVGSGKIFEAEKVVVTQPEAGQFKGFSAVCTHQSCVVREIRDEIIECKCHFSEFSIADGSVVKGPATRPLVELKVAIEGENLIVS